MNKEKIYIFDTTLRDGAQTEGVNFSIDDKNKIAKALSSLGVDYLEGGWPGANTLDTTFFNNPPKLENTILTAFGMTKKTGRSAENDPGLSALLNTNAPAICLVGKSWDFHVDVALGITKEENLENIRESAKLFIKNKKEFMFDAEHFFDGYKKNPEYALACIQTAFDEGSRWIVLCDTNGGTLPNEVGAVLAGVRQIQGTINGLGERCGNANLISLIPSLVLKKSFSDNFEIKIKKDKVKTLTECSRLLDEILNSKSNRRAAYVGPSAFAHKGGLHVSAVSKDPKTYEHIDPSLVGNVRNIIVSDQAGKSNIMSRLNKYGIKIDKNDPKVQTLLNEVKDREFVGYSYDGADASFELLARRLLGERPKYLTISKYDVSVKKESKDKINSFAKAHILVDGKEIVCEGSGNGPVNALDNAIRSNVDKVGKYSKYLKDLKLVDYKVRILNTGTNATTRVSIESTDKDGKSWFTIGVSPNIIEASFQALVDSLDYKLYKEKAPANN